MPLEKEVAAYLAGIYRRKKLARLEAMAARPTLAQRRAVRPRLGVLRRIISWLFR